MASSLKFTLSGIALLGSSWLILGCADHCACTAPPGPYQISGRLTDPQGAPLPGVEVSAISLAPPTATQQPPIGGIQVLAKASSDQDGRYTLQVSAGSVRVLSRPLIGSRVYMTKVSPELKVDASRPQVSGLDLVISSTAASAISGTIMPVRGSAQEDNLSLSEILTIDGSDYGFSVSNQKPVISGSTESYQFLLQPSGTYALFLSRSETTGTHAQSGTARAVFPLPEGNAIEVALTVQ